jgi:protein-L-isoaspartate(D-aspartate) O-methyltransferase
MEWAEQRRRMVEKQLRARGIRDERVLAAMREIPREEFVPSPYRGASYADDPVPIGHDQTISQPYMVALMAQCLELTGAETVLEVGAGCGYHAAVLAALAGRVITLELIPELAEMARKSLEKTGYAANITVICGDGAKGWPECAPYAAISVAAATSEVPPALLEQLQEGGRMVIPVGGGWEQELRVIRKLAGEITWRIATWCRFVPLR